MDISSVEEPPRPLAVRRLLSNTGQRSFQIGPFLPWQSVFKRRKWLSHKPWKPQNNKWQWHFTAAAAPTVGPAAATLPRSTCQDVAIWRRGLFGLERRFRFEETGKEKKWTCSKVCKCASIIMNHVYLQFYKTEAVKTLALPIKYLQPGMKLLSLSWPNTSKKTSFNESPGRYFTYYSLYAFIGAWWQPTASLTIAKIERFLII